jgi:hypothetical protein
MRDDSKPHELSKTKNKPLPTRLIFLDTETKLTKTAYRSKIHTLKLGIAQYYIRASVRMHFLFNR